MVFLFFSSVGALLMANFESATSRPIIAVDIGGILIKLVYWGTKPPPVLPTFLWQESTPDLSAYQAQQLQRLKRQQQQQQQEAQQSSQSSQPLATSPCVIPPDLLKKMFLKVSDTEVKGLLQFIKCPLERADDLMTWVRDNGILDYYAIPTGDNRIINVTGCGAERYVSTVLNKLGVHFKLKDEMSCLIRGLNFLLRHTNEEIFTFDLESKTQIFLHSKTWAPQGKERIFPYLLVRVGSGVSVFKVSSPNSFDRVSGSSIGGGTFWGICKLLTNAEKFEQAREFARVGNNRNVDLQVGDIYGCDYSALGLKTDVIASSFGKVQRLGGDLSLFKQEDLARSTLFMVTVNIGQLAFLNAQLEGIQTIFFTGSFLRDNPSVYEGLAWAVNFWSAGSMNALFLEHDGYLAALGALLS